MSAGVATERHYDVRPIEPYLNSVQAAAFLHRSAKTIQAWARAGILPCHPIGQGSRKSWLFLKSELDSWVRSQV